MSKFDKALTELIESRIDGDSIIEIVESYVGDPDLADDPELAQALHTIFGATEALDTRLRYHQERLGIED
jgi:hypothetical protein